LTMEIFADLEQGAPEWFAVRCGCVTASEFKTVMSKGRGKAPSKTRQTYLHKLAGEIITGKVAESYTNHHMVRGHVMEVEARELYELTKGVEVDQVGFIRSTDRVGFSPDGLVGDDGAVEIKSKLPHLQIALLLSREIPREHIHQLQGGLWVSKRSWIDFMSYWPGLPPFIKRVYRDEIFIAKIEEAVSSFIVDLDKIVSEINKI